MYIYVHTCTVYKLLYHKLVFFLISNCNGKLKALIKRSLSLCYSGYVLREFYQLTIKPTLIYIIVTITELILQVLYCILLVNCFITNPN